MPSPRSAHGSSVRRRGSRVYLAPPRARDAPDFVAAARASRRLHDSWVRPPRSAAEFGKYVARYGKGTRRSLETATHVGLIVHRVEDGAMAGVFNFGAIVRGAFRSAYLGYYAFSPLAGDGYMSDGLALALEFAFRRLRLHRVEVNVQPANARSIALVRRAGFVREGFSRRYLKVAGRWRDHVRLALTVEDWRAKKRR